MQKLYDFFCIDLSLNQNELKCLRVIILFYRNTCIYSQSRLYFDKDCTNRHCRYFRHLERVNFRVNLAIMDHFFLGHTVRTCNLITQKIACTHSIERSNTFQTLKIIKQPRSSKIACKTSVSKNNLKAHLIVYLNGQTQCRR